MKADTRPSVVFGLRPLKIEDVLELASGRAKALLDPSPELRQRIRTTNALLTKLLQTQQIYGVTTGFGDSCENEISAKLAMELPRNLMRFHGCGTGRILGEQEAAAVLAVRLAALSRGYSGVREVLLERLCALINLRVLPAIPEEGSVGASGDLTPLSYVAALLAGEREAISCGKLTSAVEALANAHLEPLILGPKESLAVMNGTSVMTALGCLAFNRASKLARVSATVTAIASDVLRGEPNHFDDRIFALKPHPGQRLVAKWIREHLAYSPDSQNRQGLGNKNDSPKEADKIRGRIQDRYSIRCAPHIIGVLVDALPAWRKAIEIEINSVNDNPIVDPETGDVLHGGNFYGGHICFAMDGMKAAIANIADLVDRQIALLCTPSMNNGLPANLVAATGIESVAHHGFKAMQISASALAAEACKLTMPASVFSRSTECHNQDKVSMGTIAARDALRVLELTETAVVIGLLAVCQAVDIRKPESCREKTREIHAAVRKIVPVNLADRRQDLDIRAILNLIHEGGLVGAGEAVDF